MLFPIYETFDWFAYTVEDFEDEPAGTDVTYNLSAVDQANILAQLKKFHNQLGDING